MWEIDNNFQLFSFGLSIALGVIFCILYDVLRAVRKISKMTDLAVFFQDIGYFMVIAFVVFLFLMAFANGEIRGYILLGILFGFILCFLTLSRFTLKIFTIIFGFLNNINLKIINYLNNIIDKIAAFSIKTIKKISSLLNNIKKYLKST